LILAEVIIIKTIG